jgi:hypothetical protein
MNNFSLLGTHGVTRYAGNKHREYILSNNKLFGFAEQNNNGSWDCYEFGVAEKNSTVVPEPTFKKTVRHLSEILQGE